MGEIVENLSGHVFDINFRVKSQENGDLVQDKTVCTSFTICFSLYVWCTFGKYVIVMYDD